jgi:subtilase family serine protease
MMAMSAMSTMYGAAQSPAAPTVPTFGETQKTATFADVVHPAQHPELTLIGPRQVWRFYNMEGVKNMGEGQTIALIGSHHDPVIERDLAVFSQRFGLPLCSVKSGCFRQIDIPDTAHAGATDSGAYTYVEESMDVEWAHAIAPKAKLMLVEAPRSTWENFLACVDAAVANGATVVSLSLAEPQRADHRQMYLDGNRHFLDPRASYVASGGDHAHTARWPASSPDVVGVGGTTIKTDETGARLGETAWKSRPAGDRYIGTGGGLSLAETEPQAQIAFGIPNDPNKMRGTPDVSYYASSRTEIAVFDSNASAKTGESGWRQGGGTSAGAPQWAGLIAVADSMRAAKGKVPLSQFDGKSFGKGTLAALYTVAKTTPAAFFDITEGSNRWGDSDKCGLECEAGPGYDYLTGLGSPNTAVLLDALTALP